MIVTTLSSAVKGQSYSTPGVLMTAGPRGAAVLIHRTDQTPQKENKGCSGQEKTSYYYFKSLLACDLLFQGACFLKGQRYK